MPKPDDHLFHGKEVSFRFRGPMNWLAFYRGTLLYFRDRRWDVSTPKYKDKTSEFEGKVHAEIRLDMYTKAIIDLEFKAEGMKAMDKPGWYSGAMYLYAHPKLEYNYTQNTPLGDTEIFPADSWLHKVFRKVMSNEIEEEQWGVPVITMQQYIDWVRELFGTEAQFV